MLSASAGSSSKNKGEKGFGFGVESLGFQGLRFQLCLQLHGVYLLSWSLSGGISERRDLAKPCPQLSQQAWPGIQGVSWGMGRTGAGELCTLSIGASCAEVEFAESLHSRAGRLRAAAHHVNVL